MTEGMVITVNSKYGEVTIKAGKGAERSYTWEGQTFNTVLIPRKERWYGKLGLYHPQLRPPHKNVVHMVAEEYQAHYQSKNKAVETLNKYADREAVYNDSGLHFRFTKQISPSGEIAIDILVSQILINGEKPNKLQGSQNSKIKVKFST